MRSTARVSSHPVHPMLVMFPFGLWTTSFIFDILGRIFDNGNLFAAGFYALIAGCVVVRGHTSLARSICSLWYCRIRALGSAGISMER